MRARTQNISASPPNMPLRTRHVRTSLTKMRTRTRLLPRKGLGTTLTVAMSPDELPNPPRKASWKRWSLALAGVLAIVLAVLFLKGPGPEPVKVWFVGTTNENGQKMLLFEG